MTEPVQRPISEEEKQTVLDLLPVALNEAGIILSLGIISEAGLQRAQRALLELEAEGRVRKEPDCGIWRVVE